MQIRSIYYIVFSLLCLSCHNKGGVIHTVERGETAYRIAHTYQVQLKEIKKANPRLQMSRIYPGQKILIPGAKQNKEVQKFIEQSMEKQRYAQSKKVNKEKKSRRLSKSYSQKNSKKRFKFKWPYQGQVTAKYGKKNGKMHNGIDIQTPPGKTLKAAEKGQIVYASSSLEGYEKMIIIQHGQAVFTVYAYLGEFLVTKGDKVNKGQAIAKTKKIKPSFYHFEIRMQKTALDPEKHLAVN
ncbi:peptidoglycan DD-metalloendopeptidase family protein [bacterium]|nr:peptidoglycan DD-metalloendopeptidase family protein [bacterium]